MGGSHYFDGSVFLSGCAHAPGAAYEIIITCIRGSVTLLIENSRPSPYFPTEWGQYSMTLQPCKCESEQEPPLVAFTPAKSPHKGKKKTQNFYTPLLPLLSSLLLTHLLGRYPWGKEKPCQGTRTDSGKHNTPALLWCRLEISTTAHIPHMRAKAAATEM